MTNKKIKLTPLPAVFLLFLVSALLTLFMIWLQPDGMGDVYKCLTENNGLSFLLNWLPILLGMMGLYCIFSSFITAASLVGFIAFLLSMINRLKIHYREDPLLPWDFSLGFEVAAIAKTFGTRTILLAVFAIVLLIVLCIIAGKFIKSTRMKPIARLLGTGICIAAVFFLNKPLYNNAALHDQLYVNGNVYNQVDQFNSKGFLYSFIYTYNTNKIAKPADYNAAAVIEQIQHFDPSAVDRLKAEKKPHLIVIMGEAYSDLAMNPEFNFSGYTDPMENYKRLESDSIHGHIAVPNIGGGTADTEFDILTGLSTRHFRGAPFAFRLITDEFEALPSILNRIGYRSEALHPGHSWFYNRKNVFRFFGFEDSVFLDEFSAEQFKGLFVSETATIDKLIAMYEQSLAAYPGTPYFGFCVTIQNHGPYFDKYLAKTNFSTTADLSDVDLNALSNYFEGVADADRELGRIAEYFENSGEPVVLVYFGDHLPACSPAVYSHFYPAIHEEGSVDDVIRLNQVPFLIWQNTAAKGLTDIEENYSALSEHQTPSISVLSDDPLFSSNYFGGYLLQLLGYNHISPYMDLLNELRPRYPIVMETWSFTADGTSTRYIDPADKRDLVLYRDWSLYKIFDE